MVSLLMVKQRLFSSEDHVPNNFDQEIRATLSAGILCDFYDSKLAKLPISFPSGPVAEICEDGHLSPHSILSLVKNHAI